MDSEFVLEVKKLSKSFLGVKALDQADLQVRRGEVHSVIGENGAGKSTMMNMILGDLPRDSGEILFNGEKVTFRSPAEAIAAGISMIHQEISLVPTLSVAENIWLHREDRFLKGGLISLRKRREATKTLLADKLGLSIDPDAPVSSLTVAQCQMVELARAVSCDSDVIIMDEPTSSLSDKEVASLFGLIRSLKVQGTAVIFITHKIEEIFQICDRVSVYRDGRYIGTRDCGETSREELISMIIGRELKDQYPQIHVKKGGVVLEVKNLCGAGFQDVSFQVRSGEILGFAGLVGAGRSEIMKAIFGIDKPYSGEILFRGEKVNITSPKDAVRHGMAMVTEDRRDYGIIGTLSVRSNLSLAALPQFCSRLTFVRKKQERAATGEMIRKMTVKAADPEMLITSLSGGNQQKVIIGRWLMTAPQLLILDEPTRGIDVGAKSEIYGIIGKLAEQGLAILMVSSEMPEILGLSDRVIVVRDGRIVMECAGEEATQEKIAGYSLG